MSGFKVWTDTKANRLHLLIRRSLSQAELQTARQRTKRAMEELRPDFSINVQQDLQTMDPQVQDSKTLYMMRIKKDLKHILYALYESAA